MKTMYAHLNLFCSGLRRKRCTIASFKSAHTNNAASKYCATRHENGIASASNIMMINSAF